MGQDSFEDIVKRKLEGQEAPAPTSVWSAVGQALDADLVVVHKARSAKYLRLAVAAVLLMLLSFGYLLINQFSIAQEGSETETFNALTEGTPFFHARKFQNFSSNHRPQVAFVYVGDGEQSEEVIDRNSVEKKWETTESELNTVFSPASKVKRKETELAIADAGSKPIYQYLSKPSYGKQQRKEREEIRSVWAGIEAGAGAFSGNLNSSESLANGLNSNNLASVSGLSDFVNPSNTVDLDAASGISRSIGLDFGVELGKKWTLESGLSLTDMQNTGAASINVLDVYTIESRGISSFPGSVGGEEAVSRTAPQVVEVRESFDTEVQVESRVQFASVPLKAGYFLIQRKFSLRLNAGLAANYLLNSTVSDPSNQLFSGVGTAMYNDWSFDGLSGLEFGLSLLNRFDFTLEPNYRYAILPVMEATTPTSQFMIQTGLRYRIQ